MDVSNGYRISSVEQLRAHIGELHPMVPRKLWRTLTPQAIDFIRQSPLLFLATSDGRGRVDVSPKGDFPGFVKAENETTLLVPDRPGNKLIFGLQNIVQNPSVGMIFLVPRTEETFRVNGTAELTIDPGLLKELSSRNRPPTLVIRVSVQQCYFHCAKAFKRSLAWRPESWPPPIEFSWGEILADGADRKKSAREINEMVEQDYKNNL